MIELHNGQVFNLFSPNRIHVFAKLQDFELRMLHIESHIRTLKKDWRVLHDMIHEDLDFR